MKRTGRFPVRAVREKLNHFRLPLQCDICSRAFTVGELFISLSRHTPSTFIIETSCRYPEFDTQDCKVNGQIACRQDKCFQCTPRIEIAAVHFDCLEYFEYNCPVKDAPYRLWQIGVWRQPWPRAPAVRLFREATIPSVQALAFVVRRLEDNSLFQAMLRLPTEVIMQIYELSEEAPFWRIVTAIDFTLYSTVSSPSSPPSRAPLDTIRQWMRGQQPQFVASDSEAGDLPVIRLTLDSHGLCEVERLGGWPQNGQKKEDRLAFIVDYATKFSNVEALFENGLMRLELPKPNHPGYPIWDTPAPREDVHVFGYWNVSSFSSNGYRCPGRYYTTELTSVRGITFFFDGDGMFRGLHRHTSPTSFCTVADWPEFTLSRKEQERAQCLYVPIAEQDEITSVSISTTLEGLHMGFAFVFQTKLVDKIVVGPKQGNLLHTSPLAYSPVAIVWNMKLGKGFFGVSYIGAYSDPTVSEPSEESQAALVPLPDGMVAMTHYNFRSSARLENIKKATIFHRNDMSCLGILLEYENGGQSALGKYHYGMQPSTVCETPICLYILQPPYYPASKAGRFASICFSSDEINTLKDGDGWTRHEMADTLEFVFSRNRSFLKVIQEE